MSHDEQTPGERLDQREKHVLLALIQDPFPWTVAELARDMGKEGRWTEDAVAALDAAGLVHRFVVLRPASEDQPEERGMTPSDAGVRLSLVPGSHPRMPSISSNGAADAVLVATDAKSRSWEPPWSPPGVSAMTNRRDSILVVEADVDLGRTLVKQLTADGYPAELALTARHANSVAGMRPPALVVLGELDSSRGALDLLAKIRGHDPEASANYEATSPWRYDLPVILLSASTEQLDLLRAFEAGTDDFLARSTGYLELRARMRALLRRSEMRRAESARQTELFEIGPLRIDTATHAAILHGDRVTLRRLEFKLLLHLASDPQRVFHKQELLNEIWGHHPTATTRTLDSHASRLRCKLRATGEPWIVNVWGVGYRLF